MCEDGQLEGQLYPRSRVQQRDHTIVAGMRVPAVRVSRQEAALVSSRPCKEKRKGSIFRGGLTDDSCLLARQVKEACKVRWSVCERALFACASLLLDHRWVARSPTAGTSDGKCSSKMRSARQRIRHLIEHKFVIGFETQLPVQVKGVGQPWEPTYLVHAPQLPVWPALRELNETIIWHVHVCTLSIEAHIVISIGSGVCVR
eukprot:scaffold210208_cov23-Tisochrysis_lutea.AAC.1